MPDPLKDPNEFTDREKFILSYFRASNATDSGRMMQYDFLIMGASVLCLSFAAAREDNALGFVAFGLVFLRLGYIAIEGRKWSNELRSIFRKYDAKLKAATPAEVGSKETDPA